MIEASKRTQGNEMILNKAQAEAVHSAMSALNNVGSVFGGVRIAADRAQHDIRVQWDEDGLTVGLGLRTAIERYADQSAFAAAYGLGAAVIEHDPNYTPPARDWTLDSALPTTPEQLRAALEAAYPPSATCWTQATDEVRDMSRGARTLLGLPESSAISFREIDTQAEWNTQGINSIVGWYASMQPEERTTFLKRIKGLY